MKHVPKPAKAALIVAIIISVSVGLGISLVREFGGFQFLELVSYDYFRLQCARLHETKPPIRLITISEKDIKRLGHWPINDGTLARLLKIVLDQKPRVVALDLYRDIPVPPGSQALESIFETNANIVTVRKIGEKDSPGVSEPFMVRDHNPVGFNDLILDSGGTVRRSLLFLYDGVQTHYAFALIVAAIYLEGEGVSAEAARSDDQRLKIGASIWTPLETDDGAYVGMDARGYQFLLDYADGPSAFPSQSMSDVLDGKADLSVLKDQIVFIGSSAESSKDFFFTPFSRFVTSEWRVPGMVIHAAAVAQILRSALGQSKPLEFVPDIWECGWIILWGLAGAFLCYWIRFLPGFLLSVLLGLVILGSAGFLAFRQGLWLPAIPSAVAFLLSSGIMSAYMFYLEKGQRNVLMRLFSTHLSDQVAEEIWEQREEFMDGRRPRPHKLIATVLFTDIQGFTPLSEKMEPHDLMSWLNEYMEVMVGEISRYKGVVNKYIGDAIMAVFGIPIARTNESEIEEDAVNAVNSAIAMGKVLARLNISWEKRGLPSIRMRVGIYTGPVMVGSVGGANRLEYTVVGDTVNIASRLESYDKQVDPDNTCRILMGDTTYKYAGRQFDTELLTQLPLKGKKEVVSIYRVSG